MVNRNKLVTGLIAGAAVGAAAGLLFAPEPGKVSRQIMAARTGDIRHKAGGFVAAIRSRRKNNENHPALVGPFEWRSPEVPA